MKLAARKTERKLGAGLCALAFLLLCSPCLSEDLSQLEQDFTALRSPLTMNTAFASGNRSFGPVPVDLARQSSTRAFVRTVEVRSFYKAYLLPKLEQRLGQVGVLHTSQLDGQDMHAWTTHDGLVQEAERQFEKGASRALRSYLSELCGLDVMVDNFADRRRRGNGRDDSDDHRSTKLSFGLGISHALPKVDMRYEIGDSSDLRMSLAASGKIDLHYGRYNYTNGVGSRTRIFASYEVDDALSKFGLRLSF